MNSAIRTAVALLAIMAAVGCMGLNSGADARAPLDRDTPGFYTDTLDHDGLTREYRVYLPESFFKSANRALVVALHGGLGTPEIFESQAQLAPAADSHGFAVVYPRGVGRVFDAGRCCGRAARENIDDVGFVAGLIDVLVRRHAIDRTRVFGTGFSNGAMLLHRIACERPGLFAAIAPVSGIRMVDPCPGAGPVAALLIQGLQDERVPWAGGELRGVQRPSMDTVVTALSDRNGCSRGTRTLQQEGPVLCRARVGCNADAPVQYCGIDGVGHQWPGGNSFLSARLGANSDAFDATVAIFEFFARWQALP